MYKIFDNFLESDTWHTREMPDEERFFAALSKVVENSEFNAEKMGDYFRLKLQIDQFDDDNSFNKAVDHYVAAAWAVKTYLNVNA